MSNTLNDIFAHLDSAKASRAYEANQERRRKVEDFFYCAVPLLPPDKRKNRNGLP